MKTKCWITTPETEGDREIELKSGMIAGAQHLIVCEENISYAISVEDIDKALHGTHNSRLRNKLKEYEHLHELDMAQIMYQRRQIDLLMEAKE